MGCGSSHDAHASGKPNMLQKYYINDAALKKKLADVKTKHGWTLAKMVNSGVENPDSSIGVYAGDDESYDALSEIFDKIIRDYHRIPEGEAIASKHDLTPVDLANLDPEGKRIVSTRIRVARNLAGYAFPALIAKEDRISTAAMLKEAFGTFTGDLNGSYYPLEGMDDATRQKLVDDHFLFKKGDRFLESAGINRDWPVGRGIFHNAEKTFLVWTHEEDMLRIISMENGGDIAAVFNRLIRGVAAVQDSLASKSVAFAQNNKLGYLSSCPTNLGTGIRASVHLKLPLLSAHEKGAKLDALAQELFLSVRGIDGEHSESKGGVYDISNKGRLGKTEKEYVHILWNGVKRLIEEEAKLEAAAAAAAAAPAPAAAAPAAAAPAEAAPAQ